MADLKEQGLERVPIIVENVVATASNMKTGTIFWSDMKLKKISRLDRGMEPVDIITTGLDLVEGLAYDWVAQVCIYTIFLLKTQNKYFHFFD